MSWRLNRTATYWPPKSSGYSSISFPFSWTAQPGAWGPSLCWDMVLIPASSLQLIWTFCHRGYIIIWRPPNSCEHHICSQFNPSTVKVIPWYLQSDAPVIYTGAFLIWWSGRIGDQYAAQVQCVSKNLFRKCLSLITQGHIQLETCRKILDLGSSVLLYPPYSPDFVLSDFHLFSFSTKCSEQQNIFSKRSSKNACGKL